MCVINLASQSNIRALVATPTNPLTRDHDQCEINLAPKNSVLFRKGSPLGILRRFLMSIRQRFIDSRLRSEI